MRTPTIEDPVKANLRFARKVKEGGKRVLRARYGIELSEGVARLLDLEIAHPTGLLHRKPKKLKANT